MRCEDCKGARGRWVRRRAGPGHGPAAQIETWRPCGGCAGTGVSSCCDGQVGGADEVTNTGEAAREPADAVATRSAHNRAMPTIDLTQEEHAAQEAA